MVKTKGSADYSFCSRTLSDRLSRKATEEEETNKLEKGHEEELGQPRSQFSNKDIYRALEGIGLKGGPSLHPIN